MTEKRTKSKSSQKTTKAAAKGKAGETVDNQPSVSDSEGKRASRPASAPAKGKAKQAPAKAPKKDAKKEATPEKSGSKAPAKKPAKTKAEEKPAAETKAAKADAKEKPKARTPARKPAPKASKPAALEPEVKAPPAEEPKVEEPALTSEKTEAPSRPARPGRQRPSKMRTETPAPAAEAPAPSEETPADETPVPAEIPAPTASEQDEAAELRREQEKKAGTLIQDIGLHKDVAVQLVQRNFIAPARITLPIWEAAVRGACVVVTGDAGQESRLLWLSVVASRILEEKIARGKPQAPSVLVVTGGDRSASSALNQARDTLSQFGIKLYGIFKDTDPKRAERPLSGGVDIVIASRDVLGSLREKFALSFDNLAMVIAEDFERIVELNEGGPAYKETLNTLVAREAQHIYFAGRQSQLIRDHLLLDSKETLSLDLAAQEWCRKHPERQWLYAIPAVEKFQVLQGVLGENKGQCAMVFANTGAVVLWLAYKLVRNGFRVDFLTSMPNPDRARRLSSRIARSELDVVICSDSVAHAISVPAASHVVNFDVPGLPVNYSARAGSFSHSTPQTPIITLVCEDYGHHMDKLSEYLGFTPDTREVPQAYRDIEDKSDNPFDEAGRFKPIWPEAEPKRPIPPAPIAERPRLEREERKPVAAAEGAAPAARPTERPRHERPAGEELRFTAQSPSAEPRQQGERRHERTSTTAATATTTEAPRLPRRDEKAKEILERALSAARDANRTRPTDAASRPPVGMDEDASFFQVAREGLGAAVAAFQATVAPEVRRRFPRMSNILQQFGFFASDRDEDE